MYPQDGPLRLETEDLWDLADIALKYGFLCGEKTIIFSFLGLEILFYKSEGFFQLAVERKGWLEPRIENDPKSLIGSFFVFDLANGIQVYWQKDLSTLETKEAIAILDYLAIMSVIKQEGRRLFLLKGLSKVRVADIIEGMKCLGKNELMIIPVYLKAKAVLSIFDEPNRFSVAYIGNMPIICLSVREEEGLGSSMAQAAFIESLRPFFIDDPANRMVFAKKQQIPKAMQSALGFLFTSHNLSVVYRHKYPKM
ncbi:MAG: hypothetical protein ABH831_01970 [Candidatus Nealsonbacteria bacterium]